MWHKLGFTRLCAALLVGILAGTNALADDAGHGHHGGMIDVTNNESAPSVELAITPDTMAGYNLHVITGNFMFTPYLAGKAHEQGTGHAHLYVDGKKIARLYGPWFHLTGLASGDHLIRVTLNGNDHRDYAMEGQPIAAEVELSVP